MTKFKIIFLLLTICVVISCAGLFLGNRTKNVLSDNLINHGVGWKNNQSTYAGSELSFRFTDSKKITFSIFTESKADQGIEIFVDGKVSFLNASKNQNKSISIKVEKDKLHTIVIRHFCTYLYDPCEIRLHSILLDGFAKLSSYPNHKKILSILGDSISTIYGTHNYSQIVTQNLGYELHNASIMGSTASMINGVDSATLRYKKDLMSFKSDLIVIFMGTNDVGAHVSLDVFEKNYSKIISDIRLYEPDSKIFLLGILPRKDIPDLKVQEYNNVINQIATKTYTTYIDTNSWLDGSDFSDAIHPSMYGENKMAKYLDAVLRSQ